MNLKRPLYGPQHPLGPSKGRDVKDFVKRTLNRLPAQLPVGGDFFPKPPGGFDDIYNEKTAQAVEVVQRFNDIKPTGNMGQTTLDALWQYADAYSKWAYRLYTPPQPGPQVPDLGPVVIGGQSLLNLRLTHPTSGIPHYPAIDAGWIVGLDAIAVENMTVTRASSANVGDAFFARGESKIEYWYGHLARVPAVGVFLRKGTFVGDIVVHPNGAHVHMGMDALPLIGRELIYGYGLGVPTVGQQLKAELG